MSRDRRSRHRCTDAEWAEIFRRFKSSGLSQREFCRREGLALSTFQRRWEPRRASARAAFVDLLPSPAPASSSWELELSLPHGVGLRFRG
jgi:hypothetical protein